MTLISCGSFSARASAALPMATIAPFAVLMAIVDGSSSTIPRPATQMSVLTVPKSIATLPRMRIIAHLLSAPSALCTSCAGTEYGALPRRRLQAVPRRRKLTMRYDC